MIDKSELPHKDYDVTITSKPEPLASNIHNALSTIKLVSGVVSFSLVSSEVDPQFKKLCTDVGFDTTVKGSNTTFSVPRREVAEKSLGENTEAGRFANLVNSAVSQKIILG